MLKDRKKLENNTKLQTILLVSNVSKLFRKLTSQVFWTRVHCSNLSLRNLRVCLVGGVKKWKDRKWWEDGKVREYKIFYFLSFLFGWEWKSGEMEKVSLYKFTYTYLLKNDGQLKQKSDQKKKKTITQFIKK